MRKPLLERLFSRVDSSGECWIYTGAHLPKWYGTIWNADLGRVQVAHKAAWEAENGTVPAGLVVCHRCDTPRCVRVDHLFLGTKKDNTQDMMQKGRNYAGGAYNPRHGSAHYQAKVTEAQVVEIRAKRAAGVRWIELQHEYGLCAASVINICNRKTWKHVS